MTTLVTGGCGVLGVRLVNRLVNDGRDVVAFDVAAPAMPIARAARVVSGDVLDPERLADALHTHGITQVAHLAAVTGNAVTRDPHRALSVNVLGTLNVFDAAVAAGVDHVVFMSSKAVVGPLTGSYIHPLYEPVPVSVVPHPNNAYGISKWCVEQLAARYATERGLGITAIRLATLFGPGKAGLGGFGFMSALVERARTGEPIEVTGADQRNDLLYVEDMAQAVTAALDRPASGYRIVQIGSGTTTSLAEFVEALRSVMPGIRVTATPGVDYAGRGVGSYYRFDLGPAAEYLGYRPAFDVLTGLADYMRSSGS